MQRPHVISFGTVTVDAFSAADLVSMRITDYPAAGEEPGGIRPGSGCPGWSGCAASAIVGWRADALWPTGLGLLVRHGITPCSEVPVFRHGRWVLLTDDELVTPMDAPAASSVSFAASWAAS